MFFSGGFVAKLEMVKGTSQGLFCSEVGKWRDYCATAFHWLNKP
jgi:hypothetical protein